MSAPPVRRGKRLLVTGLIVTTIGIVLWYEVLAMELLVVLGLALVALDLARPAHSRWRTR
jgi:hypothetical protein